MLAAHTLGRTEHLEMTRTRIENAAQLGVLLARRQPETMPAGGQWPSHAVLALQKAARALHKMDERACCEDLTCEHCEGAGSRINKANGANNGRSEDCHYCAGTGQTTGKREARILERVRAICAPYRLRVYQQGDCRGWPLYLIPAESGPATEDASMYNSRGTAVCPS